MNLPCVKCSAVLVIPDEIAQNKPNAKTQCPKCSHIFRLREALGQSAAAAAPSGSWQIERTAADGKSYSTNELEDMARDGRLRRTDLVQGPGQPAFVPPTGLSDFRTAFALRRKEVDGRLRALERKSSGPCMEHRDMRAKFKCTECGFVFCAICRTDTGTCPDCDVELVDL